MEKETIVGRLTRLSQRVAGKFPMASVMEEQGKLVGMNGLIDSLVVLHKECSRDLLVTKGNDLVQEFVKKFGPIVEEFGRLRISSSDFEVKGVIGRGHFGEVQLVSEKSTRNVYAMKVMKKEALLAQQNVSFYEEERDIMSATNSDWLVQLHHAFQDDVHLYLVMDYHPGGDLHTLLNRYDNVFEESMARFYLGEMVMALHSLHLMGYVHRDVKPENILVDRTGHVKLADFGSSCRIDDGDSKGVASSHSKIFIPVGTPDYVCPELLTLVGVDQSKLGESYRVGRSVGCDWWSLGVCAYEMMCGQLPFSDQSESGSKLATYANIMNHKETLTFPGTDYLSSTAQNFIFGLLEEKNRRLDYPQIREHAFFSDIDLDNIRQCVPPHIPTVRGEDDRSNFPNPPPASILKQPKTVHFCDDRSRDIKAKVGISGRDLPFVGFTYDRSVTLPGENSFLGSPSRPLAGRRSSSRFSLLGNGALHKDTSLELQLSQKNRELSVAFNEAEFKVQMTQKNFELAKKSSLEAAERLAAVERERDELEKKLVIQEAANNSLKRTFNLEMEKVAATEAQAKLQVASMMERFKSELNKQGTKFREEIEGYKSVMAQLEEEQILKNKQLAKLERELNEWKTMTSPASRFEGHGKGIGSEQLQEIKTKIKIEFKQAYRSKMKEAIEKRKKMENEYAMRESSLRDKLEESSRLQVEMERKLADSESGRSVLEREVALLKERVRDFDSVQDKKTILESELKKLRDLEKRERDLKQQLDNREARCHSLSCKVKCLENELDRLKNEKEDLTNQSMVSLYEHEDRLRLIQQQESVIDLLKTNINTLEQQVRSLRCDLTEARSISRDAAKLKRSRKAQKVLNLSFCASTSYPSISDGENAEKLRDDDEEDDADANDNNKDDDNKAADDDEDNKADDDDDDDDCEEVDKENLPHGVDGDDEDDDAEERKERANETRPSRVSFNLDYHRAARGKQIFSLDVHQPVVDQSDAGKIRSPGQVSKGQERSPSTESARNGRSVLAEISLRVGSGKTWGSASSGKDVKLDVEEARHNFGTKLGGSSDTPTKSRSVNSWPFVAGTETRTFRALQNKNSEVSKDDSSEPRSAEIGVPDDETRTADVATSPLATSSCSSRNTSASGEAVVMTVTAEMVRGSSHHVPRPSTTSTLDSTLDSIVEANSDVSRLAEVTFTANLIDQQQQQPKKPTRKTSSCSNGSCGKAKQQKSYASHRTNQDFCHIEKACQGQSVSFDERGELFEKNRSNRDGDAWEKIKSKSATTEVGGPEVAATSAKLEPVKKEEIALLTSVNTQNLVRSLEREIDRLKEEMEKMTEDSDGWKAKEKEMENSLADQTVKFERSMSAKEEEMVKLKESVHEQRIRVLDVKYEMREKLSSYEREISDLKVKLLGSEVNALDLEKVQRLLREKEEELMSSLESKEKAAKLAGEELEALKEKVECLKMEKEKAMFAVNEAIENLEKQLEAEKSSSLNLRKDVEREREKSRLAESTNEELTASSRLLKEENIVLKQSVDRLNGELEGLKSEKERILSQLEQLKNLCLELENQLVEMESLVQKKVESKEVERLTKSSDDEKSAKMAEEVSKLKEELEDCKGRSKQLSLKNDSLAKQVQQLEDRCKKVEAEKCQTVFKSEVGSFTVSSAATKKLKEQELETQLGSYRDENARLKVDIVSVTKENDGLKNEVRQLKAVCSELESQIKILEQIESSTKRRLSSLLVEENVQKKEAVQRETKVSELAMQFKREAQARKQSETKVEELTSRLDGLLAEQRRERDGFNSQVALLDEKVAQLNRQLSESEKKSSLEELEIKNLRRCIETRDQELNFLKEEISKEITRLQSIKSTNLTLTNDLEEARRNEKHLEKRICELENCLESLQASYQQDRYRLEETVSQQGKLIDFLQAKVESASHKKKLFGSKKEKEKEMAFNEMMRNEFKGEAVRAKRGSVNYDFEAAVAANQALGSSSQDKYKTLPPSGSDSLNRTNRRTEPTKQRPISTMAMPVSANPHAVEKNNRRSAIYPSLENHNFKTSIFCRPTKCIVCLGTIYFIQQSAKCLDCGAVCHPKCLPHLPFNCGMQSDYALYSLEASKKSPPAGDASSMSRRQGTAGQQQWVVMSGPVKVNGSALSKSGSGQKNSPWQNLKVVLKGTKLQLVTSGPSSGKEKLEAEFELCPSESEGEVIVESSVCSLDPAASSSSPSLLTPLLTLDPSDLMLVIVLKFEGPLGDGQKTRVLYLLPSNFKEKQQWTAALETVVNGNPNSRRKIRDVKVLGNVLLRLDARKAKGRKMEINCTWPYNGEVILVGTSVGLHAMILNNTADDRTMVCLDGIPPVHNMEILNDHGLLFAVTGCDRNLVLVDLASIQDFLCQSQASAAGSPQKPRPLTYKRLPAASGCTVFAVQRVDGSLFLCAATFLKTVLLFEFESAAREFVLKKEYTTTQLCSCLQFGASQIIIGAGKFFRISLESYSFADFLNPADPSLSFAVTSAAKYGSQPIAVLAVNPPDQPEEFLLCYYEFGVFVDGYGFRSREENMNWAGLPLAFAYRRPFLYMVHYNSVHLTEILPKMEENRAPLRACINLPGAAYLGPAVMPGAVYLGSTSSDEKQEIICMKGNKISEAQHP